MEIKGNEIKHFNAGTEFGGTLFISSSGHLCSFSSHGCYPGDLRRLQLLCPLVIFKSKWMTDCEGQIKSLK